MAVGTLTATPVETGEVDEAKKATQHEAGPHHANRRKPGHKMEGRSDRFLKMRDVLAQEGLSIQEATDKARKLYNKTKRVHEPRLTHADVAMKLGDNETRRFEKITQLRMMRIFKQD